MSDWPTAICEVFPLASVTVVLPCVVAAFSVWAGARVAQLSLVAAVAPAVAHPPRMPFVRTGTPPLRFATNSCALPMTLDPRPVPAKIAAAPAVRVRLPMFSTAVLPVAAAGGVTVKVFTPEARVTPAPVAPRVTFDAV